jgi:hypothetical protein
MVVQTQSILSSQSQPNLTLVEFGMEPASCRLYYYQNGNGVVYAAATGGTPDYTYLWTNLSTGVTSDNSTWGGLNPADYMITVTDDNGCILTQTITLDSLNPIADFDMSSLGFTIEWEGDAPLEVKLHKSIAKLLKHQRSKCRYNFLLAF